MLRLTDQPPSKQTLAELSRIQALVSGEAGFDARSKRAVALWKTKSSGKKTKAAFAEVKRQLGKMCAQVLRCSYCEDSMGDEIEHIWPKTLFPDRAFVWSNYCLACGPCNGPKSNRFALFTGRGKAWLELDPKKEPVGTAPLLLDPRVDDPTAFLMLDVLQTFAFVPRPGLSARELERAKFTIEVLGFNRDVLCETRRVAARSYESFLNSYVTAAASHRPDWRAHIERASHPTVWHELVRSSARLPAMKRLLMKAPEARGWRVGLASS